jgi:hypothetical protein
MYKAPVIVDSSAHSLAQISYRPVRRSRAILLEHDLPVNQRFIFGVVGSE